MSGTVRLVCPALVTLISRDDSLCLDYTYTPRARVVADGHALINISLGSLLELGLAKVAPDAVATILVGVIVGKGQRHILKGAAANTAISARAVAAKVLVLEHVEVGNDRVDVGQLVPVGHAAGVATFLADEVLVDGHVVAVEGKEGALWISAYGFKDKNDSTYYSMDPDGLIHMGPV